MSKAATHAYRTADGWAAGDKQGRTWSITAAEADSLPQVPSFDDLMKRYGWDKILKINSN
ncbi:MAG: hypothetical protein JXQ89_19520 [Pelagimonas sp.]